MLTHLLKKRLYPFHDIESWFKLPCPTEITPRSHLFLYIFILQTKRFEPKLVAYIFFKNVLEQFFAYSDENMKTVGTGLKTDIYYSLRRNVTSSVAFLLTS